jgi:hypothetical protein
MKLTIIKKGLIKLETKMTITLSNVSFIFDGRVGIVLPLVPSNNNVLQLQEIERMEKELENSIGIITGKPVYYKGLINGRLIKTIDSKSIEFSDSQVRIECSTLYKLEKTSRTGEKYIISGGNWKIIR